MELSVDEIEKLAKEAGWDNRRYMTPKDYKEWCRRMMVFVELANREINARKWEA